LPAEFVCAGTSIPSREPVRCTWLLSTQSTNLREDRARAVGLVRILHGELMLLQRVVDTVAA
jgi:hypothetical protein